MKAFWSKFGNFPYIERRQTTHRLAGSIGAYGLGGSADRGGFGGVGRGRGGDLADSGGGLGGDGRPHRGYQLGEPGPDGWWNRQWRRQYFPLLLWAAQQELLEVGLLKDDW